MNGWSCSPKHGPAQFTVLSQLFVRMAWSFSKTFKGLAGSCYPKHGPVTSTMLKNFFVWMWCSHFKNIQVDGWAALPNIPCHGPAHFTALNIGPVLMLCKLSTTLKWTAGRAPPNTVQLNSRCWVNFSSGWLEAFKKHSNFGWVVLPQTRSNSIHSVEKLFRLNVMQQFQKHSNWWLGRAPQHLLSRPSSFYGVKQSFLLEVMQTFNSVLMNGWSCSPKHGPAQFTVLSQLFVRMAPSFSKTFQI